MRPLAFPSDTVDSLKIQADRYGKSTVVRVIQTLARYRLHFVFVFCCIFSSLSLFELMSTEQCHSRFIFFYGWKLLFAQEFDVFSGR